MTRNDWSEFAGFGWFLGDLVWVQKSGVPPEPADETVSVITMLRANQH